jgi:hypothetical protein
MMEMLIILNRFHFTTLNTAIIEQPVTSFVSALFPWRQVFSTQIYSREIWIGELSSNLNIPIEYTKKIF